MPEPEPTPRMVVWKFPVDAARAAEPPGFPVEMPVGARVVHVDLDPAARWIPALLDLAVWAEVDANAPKLPRTFHLYGTGHALRDHGRNGRHVGTVITGAYVWHLYEARADAEAMATRRQAQLAEADANVARVWPARA